MFVRVYNWVLIYKKVPSLEYNVQIYISSHFLSDFLFYYFNLGFLGKNKMSYFYITKFIK